MGRPPKSKPEEPLFKLYVDSKTGNFTQRLGRNAEIEEARFMEWNIEDFMKACSLKDKQIATESMRKMLSMLFMPKFNGRKTLWKEKTINLFLLAVIKIKTGNLNLRLRFPIILLPAILYLLVISILLMVNLLTG